MAENDDALLSASDTSELETVKENIGDIYISKSGEDDLILIVEGQKVHVCKAILNVASPVFQAMFRSEFKEKNQQQVELPGKNSKDFVEFIRCFYPNVLNPITGRNVYRILPYVSEYQVQVIKERCDSFLTPLVTEKYTGDAKEIYKHLHLSETHSLDKLKDACISLASELSLAEMDKGSAGFDVSDKSQLQIRRLALKRKEMDQQDDMFMFRSNSQVNSGLRGHSLVNRTSDCTDILRAIRLALRYFKDDKEKLATLARYLNAKPRDQLEVVNNELYLLPADVKKLLAISRKYFTEIG